MGILSTIGSVAANALLTKWVQKVATKVAKAIPKPTVPATYNNVSIPTIKETQPVDSTMGWTLMANDYSNDFSLINQEKESAKKSMDYAAYRSEEIYQKETWTSLFNTTTEDELVKGWIAIANRWASTKWMPSPVKKLVDLNAFSNDAVEEVKKYKTTLQEFNSPNNRIEATLKKSLWDEKYNDFKNSLNMEENYVKAIRFDDDLKEEAQTKQVTFTRSLYNWLALDWIIDKATGGQLRAYNKAADYLNETWEIDENDLVKMAWQLVGDAPVYAAASLFGAAAAGEWLVSVGVASNSARTTQVGMNILKMQKTSPYLYAATFDSAFSTAAEYGVKKMSWLDYTAEDGLRSVVLGAVMPKAIGVVADAVGGAIKSAKWAISSMLKSSDLNTIESLIKQGSETNMTLKDIIESNSDIKMSNWKTLWEIISEVPKTNIGTKYNETDVALEFSKGNTSISSLAWKRIKSFIDWANKSIKNEAWDASEKTLAVQDLISKLKLKQSVNEGDVLLAIKEVETTHWVKIEWDDFVRTSDDSISELLHTSTFDLNKFKSSNDIKEVVESFTWKKPITVDEIDTARINIDSNNMKWPEEVEKLASTLWVKFDMDKAIDKVWLVNRDYLHKILNDIESSVNGYSKFSNKMQKSFTDKVKAEMKNIRLVWKNSKKWFGTTNVGWEAAKVIKDLGDEVKVMMGKLRKAATIKEKDAIKATIAKKNIEIENIKARLWARNDANMSAKEKQIEWIRQANLDKNRDRRALIALTKGEIEQGSLLPQYSVLSTEKVKAIKDLHKSKILNKSTLEEAQEIMDSFHNDMYKASYKKINQRNRWPY